VGQRRDRFGGVAGFLAGLPDGRGHGVSHGLHELVATGFAVAAIRNS
jgi:hypothetical protein